jgi:hypothetical protein
LKIKYLPGKGKMEASACRIKKQGFSPGNCRVKVDENHQPACQATLRYQNNQIMNRFPYGTHQ